MDTGASVATDTNKSAQILAVRGSAVQANDIYWHVVTDQRWKYSGSAWVQLASVSNGTGSSSMNMNGTNNRIEVRDSGGIIRVKIGNLA